MASSVFLTTLATIVCLNFLLVPNAFSSPISEDRHRHVSCPPEDIGLLEFPLNLEYLEAEFFLYGALGYGLDEVDPSLSMGGPSPIGATRANLDFFTRDVIAQFAWQEVGHLRAIKKTVKGFPRPLLDLSPQTFATIMEKAVGRPLFPPFNPYVNSLNFLLASYVIPYVGLTDAVIRALLYKHGEVKLKPYGITVAEFTNRISELRNQLGDAGVRDEGLVVPKSLGAEGEVRGNILAGDEYSLGYGRTPQEILRIVYGSGDEHSPGGFYPKGAHGSIATSYLDDSVLLFS
ncbi:hypothetical protein Tsubulata_042333 [Turnera subulata]|uniref:Desiccation-related protein PCC13-62 n=1 Tax=Turnera subulata TaxID=218843 RepID=A0A9Q0G4F3_9ROSI|nr:hypothetical protein Tsubulata_042333 [Turnera subulata]